jgi:hypothetical protein
LTGGPPTGPLTTQEQTDADELRTATLAKHNEPVADGEQTNENDDRSEDVLG